jgi:2-Cys peroxiredoxin 5
MGCKYASVAARAAKVGDAVPDVNLHKGFPPTMVSLKEATKGKKVVLVGLPGAFTPT